VDSPDERRRFLALEEVLLLHERLLRRFGGAGGIRDEAILRAALAAAKQTSFGVLVRPTLHAQAAAYLFHLARGRPFHGGSERTALAACEWFLARNGHELSLSDEEVARVVDLVGAGRLAEDELAHLIAHRVRPLGA
jgi:death-on-curing protein